MAEIDPSLVTKDNFKTPPYRVFRVWVWEDPSKDFTISCHGLHFGDNGNILYFGEVVWSDYLGRPMTRYFRGFAAGQWANWREVTTSTSNFLLQ